MFINRHYFPVSNKENIFVLNLNNKRGKTPQEVKGFEVNCNIDSRKALVKWKKDKSTTGYIVNYGVDANKLYTSYMVYDCDSVKLSGLNKDIPYYFSIDAFNESGITKGKKIFN